MFDDIIDTIPNTEILKSPIHGYGLFATSPIPVGTILVHLDGQVVEWSYYTEERVVDEWNALPDGKFLARAFRTFYGFINHARDPNCELVYRDIYSPVVHALRDIPAGHELTLDYRREPLPRDYLDWHGGNYL